MAFTPTAAKVWNLGEDLDEGLRLCYHKGPPEGRVLVHARRAGQARPHVEQNPLTRLHPPCNPMSENYMTLCAGTHLRSCCGISHEFVPLIGFLCSTVLFERRRTVE